MKVTVLGAGAWGTALAQSLQQGGNAVTLWGHDPDHLGEVRRSGVNERYLPGITLPRGLKLEGGRARAVAEAECIVFAVPSKAFREVSSHCPDFSGIAVSVTK